MPKIINRADYLKISILLPVMFCTATFGKTIYVDDSATGENDGSSWKDAFSYLQYALIDAAVADKPSEIRVAQGLYRPNEGLMAVPEFDWRTTTFQLINCVAIKGGYAGFGAPDPDLRNVETYKTILSGDLNANDVEVVGSDRLWDEPTRADNSYHVVTASGTDETAILDGFTITAGNADGQRDTPSARGAGVFNISGSPTLTNCTFSENSASQGCGIYNSDSNPTLADCIFVWNKAEHSGGGMYNDNSNPIITDCTFNGNSAFYGGGMYNSQSCPVLTNCTFMGNVALMIVWPNGDWMGGDGGGIYNFDSCPALSDCVFIGNSAWQGGGMNNYQSSPVLTNCKFTGNFSVERGGGMCNFLGSPTLTHSIFSGNIAVQYGGGMDSTESNPNLMNCTFSDNFADSGGGMGNFKSAPTLTNCILWGNMAGGGEQIELVEAPSSVSISYSNLQGGQAAVYDPCEALVWGQGNINADPLFVEQGYWAHIDYPNIIVDPIDPNAVWVDGDYHLRSEAGRWDPAGQSWIKDDVTSPCIDAGDPNSDWTSEIWPHGRRINMGAYGGSPRASLSIQQQEMSLPLVAYIYSSDVGAAESFKSLLVHYGCSTTLIGLDEMASAALDSYDLIIVGNDTGVTNKWGDVESVTAIESSGKPVIGLGEGGYALFGKIGLSVGWPNGMHGSRNSINVINPNSSLFGTPYPIDVPQDRILQLYNETDNVDLYLYPVPETVTVLGGEVNSPGYYPLALQHNRYLFWGFTKSPENMTEIGKHLFVNVVIWTANAAWDMEI